MSVVYFSRGPPPKKKRLRRALLGDLLVPECAAGTYCRLAFAIRVAARNEAIPNTAAPWEQPVEGLASRQNELLVEQSKEI